MSSRVDYNPSLLIGFGFLMGLACLPVVFDFLLFYVYSDRLEVRVASSAMAPLAGVIAAVLTDWFHRRREGKAGEKRDARIAHALYAEIYNRAARCALDYSTWLGYVAKKKRIEAPRFKKFQPENPVVYTSLASDLGALPTSALGKVIIFYSRLDGLRREFEINASMLEAEDEANAIGRASVRDVIERMIPRDRAYLSEDRRKLFAYRLQQTIGPALEAIVALRPALGDQYHQQQVDAGLEEANRHFVSGALVDRLGELRPSAEE